jgi:hypothetical protein
MRHLRICASLLGLLALVSCDVTEAGYPVSNETKEPDSKRDYIERIFLSQVGVKETTGKNDGPEVEAYLAATGLKKGNPWCAAFCAWTLNQGGVENPRSAWSPDWFKTNVIYRKDQQGTPGKGDVFGIWFSSMNRVAHVGFVHKWGSEWVETVEGNSSDVSGSRDGDGVYRKRRLKSQIYSVSSWID